MRNEKNFNDDVLRHYIKATDTEIAPEGFSSKVMSHIYMEARPAKSERTYIVPAVFGAVFLVMTLAALFIPHSTLNLPEIRFPDNINLTFPELESGLKIPEIFTYIVAGVIVIAIFDSGLKTLFKKEKN